MLELRPYQEEAVKRVYEYFREHNDKNPCVVLPTGAGKTIVLAKLCQDVSEEHKGKVLLVTHVKELIEQAYITLKKNCPTLDVSICSAGLNQKDYDGRVVCAGVQTIYKNACKLGKVDLCIVDEAHMIPPEGDGMYQQLLKTLKTVNPKIKLVGLTATPYRLKSGLICSDSNFLNEVCYEVNVRSLIEDGYLSRVESRLCHNEYDTTNLHTRMGEFVPQEVDELVNNITSITLACNEIVQKKEKYNRKKVLLFAANVNHAKGIKKILEQMTKKECGIVLGDTDPQERAETLKKFKSGEIEYLVNVSVLTTGFDARDIDLVAILRPTKSAALYYQMVGRGLRICDGKDYCLVLDFGQNIDRHGPIDSINVKKKNKKDNQKGPVKACPKCELIVPAGVHKCPDCGYEFPFEKQDGEIQSVSSKKNIISRKFEDFTKKVFRVEYFKHENKRNSPPTLKIRYKLEDGTYIHEWLCPEHTGYPRTKFYKEWRKISKYPVPQTVDQAIDIAKNFGTANILEITYRKEEGNPFESIIKKVTGDLPDVVCNTSCKGCMWLSGETCLHHCKKANGACNDYTTADDYFSLRGVSSK